MKNVKKYSFNEVSSSELDSLEEYISSLGEEFSQEIELKSLKGIPLDFMSIQVELTATFKGTNEVAFELKSEVAYRKFIGIVVNEVGFNYKNTVPHSEYLQELILDVLEYCVGQKLVSGDDSLVLERS